METIIKIPVMKTKEEIEKELNKFSRQFRPKDSHGEDQTACRKKSSTVTAPACGVNRSLA